MMEGAVAAATAATEARVVAMEGAAAGVSTEVV